MGNLQLRQYDGPGCSTNEGQQLEPLPVFRVYSPGGVVKSAAILARVGIRINLGPNTTLLVRILDSRLRGNDGNMGMTEYAIDDTP